MIKILASDGMEKGAVAALEAKGCQVDQQFYDPEALKEAVKNYDVLVVRSATKVRVPHIDAAKEAGKLKLVIRGGVGVDNIDVKYAEENGITVRNTPRASSQSVAELAMGHMFACARFLSIAGHTMREDKWEKKAYAKGIELQGKTLGIIGFGRIGQHLGIMAKAIGMKVVAFDIFHIPGIEEQLGINYVEMDELLKESDFISVHAPAVDGGAIINADRTRPSTATPWCPARPTSAPPRWKPRSASARRSWISSPSSSTCKLNKHRRDRECSRSLFCCIRFI